MIFYAELDLDQNIESQFDFDLLEHYSRPVAFQLTVNEKEQKALIWE